MHSSTYPHFFHGSSHRQREYATVTFMNDVMLQPMGERTPMTQSLRDRAQDAIMRCAALAWRIGGNALFGMTTALALQQVPLPEVCDLDAEMLHITSSTPDRRRRRIPGTHPHVWKLIATYPDACVPIKGNVFALHPFHAWAQLSSHVSLEELVILAEAIITAISKSSGRYPQLVLSSLREFIDNAPYFLGKTACRTALQLVKANVLSPKESKARLVLLRHGLPDAEVNCHVDRAMFDSGKPMSLDIAWKHFKVAVEYDGDHHRIDKHQWRRDRKKRDRLRQLGWTIIVITADDIRDEVACAEFALNVARELTLRGCDVDFHVIAMTVEELARREKAADRKKRRESAV